MKKYANEYLHRLEKRGLSRWFLDRMRREIFYFYRFLEEKKIAKINREAFKRYKDYLIHEKNYRYATYKGRLLNIRSYFRYLTETKRYLFNPAEELEIPERPKTLPRDIPRTSEMLSLLDGIDTIGKVGKRRKAILELFYSTGIRAKELLNLEIYDVNFKDRTLMIRDGKGKKDRVVPFGKRATDALKVYIEEVRKDHARRTGETKLFLTIWGRKLKYKMLLLVMPRLGNGKRIQAHSIRHACAVGMLRNGADIRYIQELLGHRLVTSTQIYTQILPEHLKAVHSRYHPRAKIKKKFVLSEKVPLAHKEECTVPGEKPQPLISRNLPH